MLTQMVVGFLFFFFKQKTAYEIYQCDWSSDVCSSDLGYLDYFSDVKCKVFDLNNEFYINVIGGNELKVRKEKLSNHIRKGDICSAVNDSIGLEEFCQEKLSSIEDSKYKFSLKKITTTYNQYFSANILKELAITSKLERYLETIIKETDLTDYNVFGITISVEDQIIPSFIISKIIKKFHIKSTIILGGSIPTRDRKSTRLNSSHTDISRMPSSA